MRYGLTAIKNVGEGAVESLLEVRRKQGRITSLHGLCEDLDLRLANKRVFESLIKAGAFDSVAQQTHGGTNSRAFRPRLIAAIDAACEHGARAQRDRDEGQAQLFGAFADGPDAGADGLGVGGAQHSVPLPEAPPWTESEQLAAEKETLGLYWSGHPVDRYAAELKAIGARPTCELADAPVRPARADAWGPGGPKPSAPDTKASGESSPRAEQLKTRSGDRMAVFTLEDAQGGVEVIVFPEAYQRAAALLDVGTMVFVRGKLERDDESVRILASEVVTIDAVAGRIAREVAIRVRMPADRGIFEALGAVFQRHRGDRRILFEMELASGPTPMRVRADVSAQIRVNPSPSLVAEVERIVGTGAVSLR